MLMSASVARSWRRLDGLITAGVTQLDLDLSDVHETDPSGVATLVVAAKRLRGRRGELRLTSLSDECGRVLRRLHVLS
jgi:anti-anti-sigma regulatory factor